MKLTVAMLTYQRPTDLASAIPVVLEQTRALVAAGRLVTEAGLLVIDNDPRGTGAAVVDQVGQLDLRAVVETQPGIAAARNRALDESADADLLVFIDDDEIPHPNWLSALVDTQQSTGAAAVAGAVVSDFPAPLDPWITAGAFFRRRRLPTGTPIDVAATNNLLLDMRQVRALKLRFDLAFGLSGGEDTLFTRTLHARGARLVWCNEAVVTDRVPVQRMNRRWVLLRAVSSGNSAARVDLELAPTGPARLGRRLHALGRGLIRLTAGTGRATLGTVIGSDVHQARGLRSASRGAGMTLGALGYLHHEYARASTASGWRRGLRSVRARLSRWSSPGRR